MRMSLTTNGLLDPRRFADWQQNNHQAMRTALAGAMRTVGREIATHVRRDIQARFHVAKPAFLRSVRAKVYDQKPNQLPALYIGSKIPWLGIHAQGGSIQGRMLIPLLPEHQRIGRRAFARVIAALLRTGQAFFVHKTRHTVLMAQITPENRSLTHFKRAERVRTGVKRLKRGQAIPIAVLVRRVSLRKRFDLRHTVRSDLPRLVKAVQRATPINSIFFHYFGLCCLF